MELLLHVSEPQFPHLQYKALILPAGLVEGYHEVMLPALLLYRVQTFGVKYLKVMEGRAGEQVLPRNPG